MKTCVSFMKPITLSKELNIALEHETGMNYYSASVKQDCNPGAKHEVWCGGQ